MTNPKFSIIISVYNVEIYLREQASLKEIVELIVATIFSDT